VGWAQAIVGVHIDGARGGDVFPNYFGQPCFTENEKNRVFNESNTILQSFEQSHEMLRNSSET